MKNNVPRVGRTKVAHSLFGKNSFRDCLTTFFSGPAPGLAQVRRQHNTKSYMSARHLSRYWLEVIAWPFSSCNLKAKSLRHHRNFGANSEEGASGDCQTKAQAQTQTQIQRRYAPVTILVKLVMKDKASRARSSITPVLLYTKNELNRIASTEGRRQ